MLSSCLLNLLLFNDLSAVIVVILTLCYWSKGHYEGSTSRFWSSFGWRQMNFSLKLPNNVQFSVTISKLYSVNVFRVLWRIMWSILNEPFLSENIVRIFALDLSPWQLPCLLVSEHLIFSVNSPLVVNGQETRNLRRDNCKSSSDSLSSSPKQHPCFWWFLLWRLTCVYAPVCKE